MYLVKATMLATVLMFSSTAVHAGYELVCEGRNPQSNYRTISVNCSDRNEFLEALRTSWQLMRRSGVGGAMENLCWEAYNDARDLHPSVSFSSISDAFLMRCNMGLEYAR